MRKGPADEGPCDGIPPALGSTRVLERIRAEAASAIGRMMFLWYLHRMRCGHGGVNEHDDMRVGFTVLGGEGLCSKQGVPQFLGDLPKTHQRADRAAGNSLRHAWVTCNHDPVPCCISDSGPSVSYQSRPGCPPDGCFEAIALAREPSMPSSSEPR